MRPSAKTVRIYPVPKHLVSQMWPHLVPHLIRGCEAADMTLEDIAGGVDAETDRLWAIFLNGKAVGAFVTAVHEDDAGRWLGVCGLGGRGVRQWADALDATMQLEAKAHGLTAIRFAGREAWSRVLPNLAVRGRWNDQPIFERAVHV